MSTIPHRFLQTVLQSKEVCSSSGDTFQLHKLLQQDPKHFTSTALMTCSITSRVVVITDKEQIIRLSIANNIFNTAMLTACVQQGVVMYVWSGRSLTRIANFDEFKNAVNRIDASTWTESDVITELKRLEVEKWQWHVMIDGYDFIEEMHAGFIPHHLHYRLVRNTDLKRLEEKFMLGS